MSVSRETARGREAVRAAAGDELMRRLDLYVELLLRWQATLNLVASSTLPDLWTRHIADSLQVCALVPDARLWVDLGSGGGFPGLVTALALADRPGAEVHLVESDKRKAAFLQTVSRETGAPAHVHPERIERFVPAFERAVEAVSARALAPLPQLLHYAGKFLVAGAIGVFPKGQGAESELTAAGRDNRFRLDSIPSRSNDGSCLVLVRAAPRGGDR